MHIRVFRNAFYVYGTWINRKVSKPDCKIPLALLESPHLFENDSFCMSCTCKYSCRYDFDDTPPSNPQPMLISPHENSKHLYNYHDNNLDDFNEYDDLEKRKVA